MTLEDVLEGNTIVLASSASSDTSGSVYLGRPWGGKLSLLTFAA